jgi:hypothetical protein
MTVNDVENQIERDKRDLKFKCDYEIDSCCQTLCVSSVVKDYITSLEDEIVLLKNKLLEIESENIVCE